MVHLVYSAIKQNKICLCVDDFGVKYYNIADIYYLKNTIESQYTCKIDWEEKNFLGYTLDWQYTKDYIDLTIPDYIRYVLKNYNTNKKYIHNTLFINILKLSEPWKMNDLMQENQTQPLF